jgi:hypothetical protein
MIKLRYVALDQWGAWGDTPLSYAPYARFAPVVTGGWIIPRAAARVTG